MGDKFAERALAVCASSQQSKDGWPPFPAEDFDPKHPDATQFPVVGAWLETEVAPTFDGWLSGLVALGSPPTGQDQWTDVLTAVRKVGELNAAQVQAAKTADAKAFVDATNGLQAVQPELEETTDAAGVAKCAEVHAD